MIDRERHGFSFADQSILRDLAALVEDELASTSQAIIDELTGLANRKGFDVVSRHLLNLCRRVNGGAEFIAFDLDGLKGVNDRYGDERGDLMLRRFAALLVKTFHGADVIARLAGDEFGVLMFSPDTDSKVALEQLVESSADTNATNDCHLSWSAGSVMFDPKRHMTIESMVEEADQRMYESKSDGSR